MHHVYQFCKEHDIPIIGQGGVTCTEDAIEFLIAGATTVGIGTALFYDPLDLQQNRGIVDYIDSHELSSLSQLTGSLSLNTATSSPRTDG